MVGASGKRCDKGAGRLRRESGQTLSGFEAAKNASKEGQTLAQILLFSGAGALLAGSGLLVWDFTETEEGITQVGLAPQGDGGMVTLRGSW